MSKRIACVDLTEDSSNCDVSECESDSETQEETPTGEEPIKWKTRMAIVLIGACRFTYVHLRDRFLFHGEDNFEQVIEWGKPFLVSDDYL